jgi:hypothetical protein
MYKMIRLGKACHHAGMGKEVQDFYTKSKRKNGAKKSFSEQRIKK